MDQEKKEIRQSIILIAFSGIMEWGSQWLTLSRWLLKGDKHIFIKLEILMLGLTGLLMAAPFFVRYLPWWGIMAMSILMLQRLVEFFIVYSRNFILHRGRIYSHFHDENTRGAWLLIMFSLNVIQVVCIFATWYQLISLYIPDAFNHSLNVLDSLYFSVIIFTTVGLGDLFPVAPIAKILVMAENTITFYTLVVVVNGLISLHFKQRSKT